MSDFASERDALSKRLAASYRPRHRMTNQHNHAEYKKRHVKRVEAPQQETEKSQESLMDTLNFVWNKTESGSAGPMFRLENFKKVRMVPKEHERDAKAHRYTSSVTSTTHATQEENQAGLDRLKGMTNISASSHNLHVDESSRNGNGELMQRHRSLPSLHEFREDALQYAKRNQVSVKLRDEFNKREPLGHEIDRIFGAARIAFPMREQDRRLKQPTGSKANLFAGNKEKRNVTVIKQPARSITRNGALKLEERYDLLTNLRHNLIHVEEAYKKHEISEALTSTSDSSDGKGRSKSARNRKAPSSTAVTFQNENVKKLTATTALSKKERAMFNEQLYEEMMAQLHTESTSKVHSYAEKKAAFLENELVNVWDDAIVQTRTLCQDHARLLAKIKDGVMDVLKAVKEEGREHRERLVGTHQAISILEDRIAHEVKERSDMERLHSDEMLLLDEKYSKREDALLKSKHRTETVAAEVNTTVNAFHNLFRNMHRKQTAAKEGNTMTIFGAWRELKNWQTRVKLKYQLKVNADLKEELKRVNETLERTDLETAHALDEKDQVIKELTAKLQRQGEKLEETQDELERVRKEKMQAVLEAKSFDGKVEARHEWRYFPRPRTATMHSLDRFRLAPNAANNIIMEVTSKNLNVQDLPQIDIQKLAFLLFASPNEDEYVLDEEKEAKEEEARILAAQQEQEEDKKQKQGKKEMDIKVDDDDEDFETRYYRQKREKEEAQKKLVAAKLAEEDRLRKFNKARYGWNAHDGSEDSKLPPVLWVVNVIQCIYSDRMMYELLQNQESAESELSKLSEFVFSWFVTQAQEEKVKQEDYYTQPSPCRAPRLLFGQSFARLSVQELATVRREQFLRGLITYRDPAHSNYYDMVSTFICFLQEDFSTSVLSFALGFLMHAFGSYRLAPIVDIYGGNQIMLRTVRRTTQALLLTSHANNTEKNFKQVFDKGQRYITKEVDSLMTRAKLMQRSKNDQIKLLLEKNRFLTPEEREGYSLMLYDKGVDCWVMFQLMSHFGSEIEGLRKKMLEEQYNNVLTDTLLQMNSEKIDEELKLQELVKQARATGDEEYDGDGDDLREFTEANRESLNLHNDDLIKGDDTMNEDQDEEEKRKQRLERASFQEFLANRHQQVEAANKLELLLDVGACAVDIGTFSRIVRRFMNFSFPSAHPGKMYEVYPMWLRPGFKDPKPDVISNPVTEAKHTHHHYHTKNYQMLVPDETIAHLYRQTHRFGGGKMTCKAFLLAVESMGLTRTYRLKPLHAMYHFDMSDYYTRKSQAGNFELEKKKRKRKGRGETAMELLRDVKDFVKVRENKERRALFEQLQRTVMEEYGLAQGQFQILSHYPVAGAHFARLRHQFERSIKFASRATCMFNWRVLVQYRLFIKATTASYHVDFFAEVPTKYMKATISTENLTARMSARVEETNHQEAEEGKRKERTAIKLPKSEVKFGPDGELMVVPVVRKLNKWLIKAEMRNGVAMMIDFASHEKQNSFEEILKRDAAQRILNNWQQHLASTLGYAKSTRLPAAFWPIFSAGDVRNFSPRQWPKPYLLDTISQLCAGFIRRDKSLDEVHAPYWHSLREPPTQFALFVSAFFARCSGSHEQAIRSVIDLSAGLQVYARTNHRIRIFGYLLGVEPVQERLDAEEAKEDSNSKYISPRDERGYNKHAAGMYMNILEQWALHRANSASERRDRQLAKNRQAHPNASAGLTGDGFVSRITPMPLSSTLFLNNVPMGSSLSGETKYLSGVYMLTREEAEAFATQVFKDAGSAPTDQFEKEFDSICRDAKVTGYPKKVNFDLLLESLTYAMLETRETRLVKIQSKLMEYSQTNSIEMVRLHKQPVFKSSMKSNEIVPTEPTSFMNVNRYLSFNQFEKLVEFIDMKFPPSMLPHAYVRLIDEARKKRDMFDPTVMTRMLVRGLIASQVLNPNLSRGFYDERLVSGGTLITLADDNAHYDWEVLNNLFYHRKPLLAKQHQLLHVHAHKKRYALISNIRKKFMASVAGKIPDSKDYDKITVAWQQYRLIVEMTANAMEETGLPNDGYVAPIAEKKPVDNKSRRK